MSETKSLFCLCASVLVKAVKLTPFDSMSGQPAHSHSSALFSKVSSESLRFKQYGV